MMIYFPVSIYFHGGDAIERAEKEICINDDKFHHDKKQNVSEKFFHNDDDIP